MPKKKMPPTDGLGPREIKKIRTALRLVWHRSHARKLAVQRCTGKDGFAQCEKCKKRTPNLKIDHKRACGDVDGGYINRLFCPSQELQGMCPKCHNEKTKAERKAAKAKMLCKRCNLRPENKIFVGTPVSVCKHGQLRAARLNDIVNVEIHRLGFCECKEPFLDLARGRFNCGGVWVCRCNWCGKMHKSKVGKDTPKRKRKFTDDF